MAADRNNAGKTSLLEAIFLLAGGGNPELELNANVVRGSGIRLPRFQDSMRDTYWKPMLTYLETGNAIEISGESDSHGLLSLKIALENQYIPASPF